MAELGQGRIIALLCVLFISCSTVDGNDDTTTVEPGNENCNCDLITIILYVTACASVVTLVVVLILVLIHCIYCQQRQSNVFPPRNSRGKYTEGDLTTDITSRDSPGSYTEGDLTTGRISNVELWKLVVYSANNKENDKLYEAILQLTGDKQDIPNPGYNTYKTDHERNLAYFQPLCRWKNTCAGTEQMDKLFQACLQAKMEKTVKELKGFRNEVSDEVSEFDLEHILWQIGKKSSENIRTLLSKLKNTRLNQEPRVPENIRRALPKLQKWTKGSLAINPTVMLSLQSDDLCNDDMYFFNVSEQNKRPLEDDDITEHVYNVSKAHYLKVISIISEKGKSKRTKEENVDRILDENETELFNTSQMIKEWLDEQECSDYDKRLSLRNAVEDAKKKSTSNEICLGEIKQLVSNTGDAEAAYELLMKDIKPFAAILHLDDSKLIKYKQESRSPQSPRGTIGLVAKVRAIHGIK